jgi:hypothetical protein
VGGGGVIIVMEVRAMARRVVTVIAAILDPMITISPIITFFLDFPMACIIRIACQMRETPISLPIRPYNGKNE